MKNTRGLFALILSIVSSILLILGFLGLALHIYAMGPLRFIFPLVAPFGYIVSLILLFGKKITPDFRGIVFLSNLSLLLTAGFEFFIYAFLSSLTTFYLAPFFAVLMGIVLLGFALGDVFAIFYLVKDLKAYVLRIGKSALKE